MRYPERMIMLSVIDDQWKDHLLSMDHLKEGIGLRGYGAERSAGRVQEGVLRHVRRHDGSHRGRDRCAYLFFLQVAEEMRPPDAGRREEDDE